MKQGTKYSSLAMTHDIKSDAAQAMKNFGQSGSAVLRIAHTTLNTTGYEAKYIPYEYGDVCLQKKLFPSKPRLNTVATAAIMKKLSAHSNAVVNTMLTAGDT